MVSVGFLYCYLGIECQRPDPFLKNVEFCTFPTCVLYVIHEASTTVCFNIFWLWMKHLNKTYNLVFNLLMMFIKKYEYFTCWRYCIRKLYLNSTGMTKLKYQIHWLNLICRFHILLIIRLPPFLDTHSESIAGETVDLFEAKSDHLNISIYK